MNALAEKIAQLQAIRDSLQDIAIEMLNESIVKAQIEDKIIAQLKQGLKGDGTFMPNYSPRSVSQFGKPFGPIKLYETGDYYQGVTAKAFGSVLEIDDSDSKDPMLTLRFGPEIKQLTDQSLSELQEDVFIPNYIALVNKRLSA